MLVTIRLFARLREIAGMTDLKRELPDGATARTAWESLVLDFPALSDYERSISCAVNEDYARFTTALKDGDEVAFLPPVSGGGNKSISWLPVSAGRSTLARNFRLKAEATRG